MHIQVSPGPGSVLPVAPVNRMNTEGFPLVEYRYIIHPTLSNSHHSGLPRSLTVINFIIPFPLFEKMNHQSRFETGTEA